MTKNNQKKNANRAKRVKRSRATPGLVGFFPQPTLLKSKLRGTMSYNTAITLSTPAANSLAVNVFRLNSVYDPDFTGVGSSVAGYSQMAAMYGRYRVLGARFTVSWVNNSQIAAFTAFLAANPVTTVGTSIAGVLQQRHIWFKGAGSVTGTPALEKAGSATTAALYGVPPAQVLAEDDFAGLVGGNPNNGTYLHVGVYSDAAIVSVTIHVRIEYDVMWSLPLELA